MKSEFLTAHGKILLAIYSNEGCTVKEALERSYLAPNTFYKAKDELVEDKLVVEKEEQRGRTRVKRLYLTEKGLVIVKALQMLVDAIDAISKIGDNMPHDTLSGVNLQGAIETKRTEKSRKKEVMMALLKIINKITAVEECAKVADIITKAREEKIEEKEVIKTLKELKKYGIIYESNLNCYKAI
ncbi:MarR family winged helix-turn-helix transcriptional regulator [Saccharolobus islandicus]|uniref:Uncharacterized protein n=1 Tax=Saccharolobus islandicus (strain L.D.8.5 / Lassen \|nr:MarR family winged helix-turn-helix transcriptional regulator [Sulfolobus islandicus]ADB87185.1 hypothetical protein LD85_1518 [Sulfolobus islandicus L.D.8.5]